MFFIPFIVFFNLYSFLQFSMNAFDLINKAGMLNLTRLIRNTKTQITKAPSYFTTHSEPNEIIFRIRTLLDKMPYIGYKYDAAVAKVCFFSILFLFF